MSKKDDVLLNSDIRFPEVRCIGDDGTQYGIISSDDALAKAESMGLDLVLIAPNGNPPVCKIMDYGIAGELGLSMKINDIEYQGDATKAIFYYTAEERVDFRQLIRVLADTFKVRIEMKQIGVRQEAARIGGIGSCGRELCCSTWMTDFKSVTTQVARTQQLSLNPQKLAGQCGKLKCCLNFEQDAYVDALDDFPETNIPLVTKKGEATYQKLDVFKKIMWYTYVEAPEVFHAIPASMVKFILSQNKKGKNPESLEKFVIKEDDTKELDIRSQEINQWKDQYNS